MAPGPILIFDKSALQSLSVDESVWLDHFFLTNMTPIFFVETLADLQKIDPRGHPADSVVAEIADKTPVFHINPNVFHRDLVMQDLLGWHVPLTWQIPAAGGVPKRDPNGGLSAYFVEAPEAAMLRRWKARQFEEAERLYARQWRALLSGVDFAARVDAVQRLLGPGERVANLADAKAFADAFIGRRGREVLIFAGQFLSVPGEAWPEIERRYASEGRPSLNVFAPYAAFVLSVDLVFYLAMSIDQISAERPSNVIDLNYLYYAPFCMVFVSGDNLHARLAPLFLRPDQVFVRAPNLKAGLKALNEHYAQHREEIERMGVVTYAHEPPAEVPTIVTELWDRCLPGRRERGAEGAAPIPPSDQDLLARIEQIKLGPAEVPPAGWDGQAEAIVVETEVPLRRGSWRLVPEGVENRSG